MLLVSYLKSLDFSLFTIYLKKKLSAVCKQ